MTGGPAPPSARAAGAERAGADPGAHGGGTRGDAGGGTRGDAGGDAGAPARPTPLLERHVAAGARMAVFAGYQMPLHYPPRGSAAPVREEHLCVREACGVFDVSHMGQIEVTGPGALRLLQRLLSNDVARMRIQDAWGVAQYSVLCDPQGGVLDDVIAYRLGPDRFLVVTNAANHGRDVAWFHAHAEGCAARVRDRHADYAMLAVQGPTARRTVQWLTQVALPPRMRTTAGRVAGVDAIVCASGYTGEDGLELLVDPRDAPRLWDELLGRGARPAGLAARDTLRLEACLPLYGNELSTARGPIEAGLGWCCHENTGFVGASAVRAARAAGPAERLVAFKLAPGAGIARGGNPIAHGGEVTSGALSPCLGVGIGLAYVPSSRAAPGTVLTIDVRGRERAATVVAKPLVAGGRA